MGEVHDSTSREAFLSAEALDENDLAQAYVLVGLCHDGISLERWRTMVMQAERPEPLVWKSIRDSRGYIHAVFAHRREHDMHAGATLVVTEILTVGPASRAAMEAINGALHNVAGHAACPTIRILLHPDRESPGADRLRRFFGPCGYVDKGPYLTRTTPHAVR
jgi:hypothetical protein